MDRVETYIYHPSRKPVSVCPLGGGAGGPGYGGCAIEGP